MKLANVQGLVVESLVSWQNPYDALKFSIRNVSSTSERYAPEYLMLKCLSYVPPRNKIEREREREREIERT